LGVVLDTKIALLPILLVINILNYSREIARFALLTTSLGDL